MIAAFFLVPNIGIPAPSKASTMPAHSGSSWLQTARSIAFSFAKAISLSNSMTPIGTHSAQEAMPALPGAQ